jgi:putative hydrolase of the HAD superfamily
VLILDLDGTVYPADSGLATMVDTRTATFLKEQTGLDDVSLAAVESRYPSVLDGLSYLGIARDRWVRAVYENLPYDRLLHPDQGLKAVLARVPCRRVVVTLAPAGHAREVLARLGLTGLIQEVHSVCCSTESVKSRAYADLAASRARGQDPDRAEHMVVVGDNPRLDLDPAKPYGWTCLLVGRGPVSTPYPAFTTLVDALAGLTGTRAEQIP